MAKKLYIGLQEVKTDEKLKKKSEIIDEDKLEIGVIESLNRWIAARGKLKLKDKVIFYRLFATMIRAGVSIIKSLDILIDQVESVKLKIVLEHTKSKIKKGKNLSDVFENDYPDEFTDAEVGMIRAGEASGKLNDAMISLAEQAEKSSSINKKLKGAMMYPCIVFILLICALFAVMTYVIPQIKEMFEALDAELPMATQMLIKTSDFLVAQGGPFGLRNVWNVLGSIIMTFLFLNFLRKTKSGKMIFHNILINLPIFGLLNKKVAISKMCRGLASLLGSGLSVIKTLVIVSNMIGNEVYRIRVLKIVEDVKIGITIADNLRGDTKLFPPIVISMIGVGEQTAQLDKISMRVAEFFEDEVNDMIKNISSLIEPIIIVVVGLSVGGLVVAIMLPILSLSDLAGGG